MKRVYFIKPIGMDGPIKIGCSQSPDGRRESLECWSPFALEILAEIDGEFYLEQRFHAQLRASHQRREWFATTPELLAVIEQVKAGTFDTDSLPDPVKITGRGRKSSKPLTEAESYQRSARARIRNSGQPWQAFFPHLKKSLPDVWSAKSWFEHRESIEELIVANGGNPWKPARSDAAA